MCLCRDCDGGCAFMARTDAPRPFFCNGCAWSRLLRDPKVRAALVEWIRGAS